jgi:phytanoyl-CoA hydroxylase
MLTMDQVNFYNEHGYLHIPQVFNPTEIEELSDEMDRLVQDWATTNEGWTGPWRKAYMDPTTEKKSKLTSMHDLHFYSDVWCHAIVNSRMVEAVGDLLGTNVELHHSTMHIKPPETGHPFPMHQDNPFYAHQNGNYVDVLVHLDDTRHENGEIRFLDGSHKLGALTHITQMADGTPCTPHLPVDKYRLEDTIPVPARRGDLVVFNIYTIHGSYINTTREPRRLVRVGYRDPENCQTAGQSLNRPSLMVKGYRPHHPGQELFPQS